MRRIPNEMLRALNAPRLASLQAFTVYPRDASNDCVNEKSKKQPATLRSENLAMSISEEQRDYLQSIADEPLLTTTQRARKFGFSAYKHDKIKKGVIAAGLVEEASINGGTRTNGIFKILILTDAGGRALNIKTISRPKNCSAEHWWYQNAIASWYRAQGFKAEIEWSRNGKRADVGVQLKNLLMAIEVAMSAKNEVRNVLADLEAGFDRVRVACVNARVKSSVEEALREAVSSSQAERVEVVLLSEGKYLDSLVRER